MIETFFEILTLGFMQRALIGGVLVALLTSLVGVLVVLRRSSFFGDAVAHASLLGVAFGLLLGLDPVLTAVLYAIIVAVGLPYLRKHSNLPIDSLLGFILPFSMGLGVILLSVIPGYQPELLSFLFGSILSVGWSEILIVATLVGIAFVAMIWMNKKLIFTSFDYEYAKIAGLPVDKIDVLYHVLLATTVVSGIQLVGIILVNALLVIPASTVRLFAHSLKHMFFYTPIVSVAVTVVGLVVSYVADIPTGPTIAVVSGLMLLAAIVFRRFL